MGAALYVRVSTSDRGQTVQNQLQPLQEAAGRLGWTVGISGTRGRDKRPGLDALLKVPSGQPPINVRIRENLRLVLIAS
jgi:DNA invertase Pin-like site-specific DNA recombinase